MSKRHAHFNAYLALLIILIAVSGFLYGLYAFFGAGSPASSAPQQAIPFQKAPTPTAADYTAAQQSFQYVVSYTSSGFRPSALSIKVGQTVRFTNLTANAVVIKDAGTSSPSLAQNMYWQYTASKAGTSTFTAGGSSITITAK